MIRGSIVVECDWCEGEEAIDPDRLVGRSVMSVLIAAGWSWQDGEYICDMCVEEADAESATEA